MVLVIGKIWDSVFICQQFTMWKYFVDAKYFFTCSFSVNFFYWESRRDSSFTAIKSLIQFLLHMLKFESIARWHHHLKPWVKSCFQNFAVSFFTQSLVSDRCFIFHPIFHFGPLFNFSPNHLRPLFHFSPNHSFSRPLFHFSPKIWRRRLILLLHHFLIF